MDRISWDSYFIEFARTAAKRSTCLRVPAGVGAVIVRDHNVVATGYAGSIKGQGHCTEGGCLIDEKTGGCVRTVHAEINAILQAAKHGASIDGASIYTTMSPCWDCFKAIANGGIKRVVYTVEYRDVRRQREFAQAIGISWEHHGFEFYIGGKTIKCLCQVPAPGPCPVHTTKGVL